MKLFTQNSELIVKAYITLSLLTWTKNQKFFKNNLLVHLTACMFVMALFLLQIFSSKNQSVSFIKCDLFYFKLLLDGHIVQSFYIPPLFTLL